MNVHHLELFYYVARHGGIMPAVRKIPYGIQQPAVSSQVAALEEHLGVTLFQRRPFALTAEGKKLYDFVEPFFGCLGKMTAELQGGKVRHIRIGASGVVLRDHLPDVLHGVKKKFPDLKISLREGMQAQLEDSLKKDEIDLSVALIEKKPSAGIHSLSLLELPLILVVPKSSPIKKAEDLWKLDKIPDTLICLAADEPISRNFQKRLGEIGVEWSPGFEASSLEMIEIYVAKGLGLGVLAAIPKKAYSQELRVIPLPGFPPITVGVQWRGSKTPLIQAFLDEGQNRINRLKSNTSG